MNPLNTHVLNKPTQLALLLAVLLQAHREHLCPALLEDLSGYPSEAVDIQLIVDILQTLEARH